MKKSALLIALMSVCIIAYSDGITIPSSLDCGGYVMPPNMAATIATASSGVGSVVTITSTSGSSKWTQTVDTSVANTTKVSCATRN